jgi:hypothetical protein
MMTEPNVDFFRNLEQALHQPDVRHSRQELEALLAEGFVEIGRSGLRYDRQDVIASLLSEPSGGAIASHDFSASSIARDVVLLTYRSQHVRSDGTRRQTLRSSVWCRRDGRWQMAFHQGTPAP